MGGRVKMVYDSLQRHWALINSRPSANVRLLVRHLADLAAALPEERRVSARRGWAGKKSGLFEQPAGHFSFFSALRHMSFSVSFIISFFKKLLAGCGGVSDFVESSTRVATLRDARIHTLSDQ